MWDALCFIGSALAAEEVASAVAPTVVAVQAMPPVADAFNQLLSTIIVAFIIPTIGYAAVLARAWLKAKIDKIKNDELRAAADFAMQRMDRIVTNVVKEIQQTKPTGVSLTKEQSKHLLTVAYNRVKAQVTDDILDIIKTVVKDPDRYTITKIEAAVHEQKIPKTTAECK